MWFCCAFSFIFAPFSPQSACFSVPFSSLLRFCSSLLAFWDPFPPFASILVAFWYPFGPFGVPLLPCWLHVGDFGYLLNTIWATFASTVALAFAFVFCLHFWGPFASMLASCWWLWVPFRLYFGDLCSDFCFRFHFLSPSLLLLVFLSHVTKTGR